MINTNMNAIPIKMNDVAITKTENKNAGPDNLMKT